MPPHSNRPGLDPFLLGQLPIVTARERVVDDLPLVIGQLLLAPLELLELLASE